MKLDHPTDSSEETARKMGAKKGKVQQARTILDHPDIGIRAKVLEGSLTINQACQLIKSLRNPRQKPLKIQQEDNPPVTDWVKHSWDLFEETLEGEIQFLADRL